MPHPPKEHEKTDNTNDYQNEEEPPTSLDDWERAVESWFYEIMGGG